MFDKDAEINHSLVIKKLHEIVAARGKKRTDRFVYHNLFVAIKSTLPIKVWVIKFATCSEGHISASRHHSLNLKGSAESAVKSDSLTQFSLL